jgi:hypothetical protein
VALVRVWSVVLAQELEFPIRPSLPPERCFHLGMRPSRPIRGWKVAWEQVAWSEAWVPGREFPNHPSPWFPDWSQTRLPNPNRLIQAWSVVLEPVWLVAWVQELGFPNRQNRELFRKFQSGADFRLVPPNQPSAA